MTDRWPDGCPREAHTYDGLCVLTRVETLPPADPEPDERGGAT